MLNVPYVQQKISVWVSEELSELLQTEVTVGRINAGLLNRIIIDDLLIDDKSGKEMVKISRLSAKFDILPLFQGRISIGSVQLFGFDINLNRPDAESDTNCQFIVDALAPADTIQKKTNIDLRINSFLIRRGKFAYDVLSEPETPGKFNANHIKLYNIIGNISLKAFQTDSINAHIRRLSVDEQSGFELRKLNLKVLGNQSNMVIEDFGVELPNTSLNMDTIRMSYDSLGSFKRFATDVKFNFNVLPSYVALQDISPFVPVLSNFKDRINLELDASGTIDQLTASRIYVGVEDLINLRGKLTLQDLSNLHDAFVFGQLSHLSINREGLEFLTRNFYGDEKNPYSFFSRLGNVVFNGEISGYFTDLVMYGNFNTSLGLLKGDVKFSSDKEKGTVSYSGGIKTEEFNLGGILNNNKWGNVTFNLDVNTTFGSNAYPYIVMKGLIGGLEYSDYRYENITLDGEYKNGGFDGHIDIDDENGSAFLNGSFNLVEKVPTFDFLLSVKNFNPHALNLTKNYEESEFSLNLNANFSGGNIDEMMGTIQVDSFFFKAPDKEYFLDKLVVSSNHTANKKTLSVNSSFMNANIQGDYSYRNLYSSFLNIAELYLPALSSQTRKRVESHNNFGFTVNVSDTEVLSTIFNIPLNIYNSSTIKGYLNDDANRFRVEAHFPALSYGKTFIESGLLICENPNNELTAIARLSNHRKADVINLSLNARASNNKLTTDVSWGNNAQNTYSGQFKAHTNFTRDEEIPGSPLKTLINIEPTDVILNDTVWKIHPSSITADEEKIHIDDFKFSRENQFLHLDGYLSKEETHSATLELKGINLGYIFDIFNLGSVDFGGLATGKAHITKAFDNPVMNTDLFVKDFRLNKASLGDMDIHGEWHNEEEGIYIDARIKEKELSDTNVKGYIYPVKPKSGLDLNINATNLNIGFIQEYMKGITSNISGRGTGNVRLYGTFKTLNLSGSVDTDASLKVDILDTSFSIQDSIYLSPTEITFKNSSLKDVEGHWGILSGYVRHTHFKNMTYRLNINSNNMLVMNTPESSDSPFYGKVYATGTAILYGNVDALTVDAAVTTNRNTNFVYSIAPTASAASSQFINFVDKTPSRNYQDSIPWVSEFELAQKREQNGEDSELDVRLNIQIDATPDATIRIIMDPVSGDYISGRGNGNIRTEYYNKGDVKMFGNYNITQGIYKFSLQEVIRKDFLIKEGSNIIFNGNPYDANMNVQAIYTVNTVSLIDLVPAEMLAQLNVRPNVRVNSVMNLSGSLDNPDIRLAIELPNERDEVQALVRNYINTEEDINMQVLYLLAIGKFYTPDYLNLTQNSNMMSSALSSTLSGQFNNMLSQILNNNNWNFGTNLSTGDRGWTDVEIEGILSAQLLNNRLLINGNFGYRDNPFANTNFVGDFEAEWLLNRSGDIRLRAYNKTNDKYYIRTNLTTQGVGILFKKDFDNWNDLFFWKRKKYKPQTQETDKAAE